MPTIAELEEALIRAHDARDYEAAQVIADEIRAVQSGQPAGSADQSGGILQTADDVVRLAGNAVTFNLADKIAAMGDVGPLDYFSEQGDVALAKQRALTDQARGRIRAQGGGTWATVPKSFPLVGGAEIGLDTVVDTAAGVGLGGGLAKNGISLLASDAARLGGGMTRIGRAAAEGAGYGAAYNIGSTDSGKLPDYFWNGVKGARDGALMGGTVQAAGQGVVGVGRSAAKWGRRLTGNGKPMDYTSAGTRRKMGEAMLEDEITSANVNKYGPDAILADNGFANRALLRGAAQEPSPEVTRLKNRLVERDKGTSNRLQNDVDAELGPVQKLPDARIEELRKEFGTITPRLKNVFASAPKLDARGIVTVVRAMKKTAKGPELAALNKIEGMLVKSPAVAATPDVLPVLDRWVTAPDGSMHRVPGSPGKPGTKARPEKVVSDAETLHNVKVAIDQMIDYGDQGSGIAPGALRQKDGAAKRTRTMLKTLLNRVSGYDGAMEDYRMIKKRMDGVDTGKGALSRGENVIHPTKLESAMTADGGNAAADIRLGMRGRIDQSIHTADELPTLRRTLGGENDWNRAKMEQGFGPNATNNVVNSVDREMVYKATKEAAMGGSRTAENALANAAVQAAPNRMIRMVDLPFRLLDGLLEYRTAAGRSANARQIAKLMGLQGDDLKNFVAQMEGRAKTNAKVNAKTSAAIPGLLNASGDDEAIPFIESANGWKGGYYTPRAPKTK